MNIKDIKVAILMHEIELKQCSTEAQKTRCKKRISHYKKLLKDYTALTPNP